MLPSRMTFGFAALIGSLALAACGGSSYPTVSPFATSSAKTGPPPGVSVTAGVSPTPSVLVSTTLPNTLPAVAEPSPPAEVPCDNDAEFLEDLTVPDGMHFLAGQLFDKKWAVRNTGRCDWGPDYRLVLIGGEALGAPGEAALYPARGGTIGVWELQMQAPPLPGTYTGHWQARDPQGNFFGDAVYVIIVVVETPSSETPLP